MKRLLTGLLVLALPAVGAAATATGPAGSPLEVEAAARFAALALECVHREYPNKIGHVMQSRSPATRADTGVVARTGTRRCTATGCSRGSPGRSPTPSSQRRHVRRWRSLRPRTSQRRSRSAGRGRASFERPYGLAWLLQLAAEARTWDDPRAREWAMALSPLEIESAQRIMAWLPKLNYPIRSGEHSQTAFAFGLIWDWPRRPRRRRHDPAARSSRPNLLRE